MEVPTDFGFTRRARAAAPARRAASSTSGCPMARAAPARRRRASASTAALWKEIAELGWVGLVLPEALGGAGLGCAAPRAPARGDGPPAGARPVPRRRCSPASRSSAAAATRSASAGCRASRRASASRRSRSSEPGGGFEAERRHGDAPSRADGGFVLRGAKTHVARRAPSARPASSRRSASPRARSRCSRSSCPRRASRSSREIGIDPTRPTARVAFDGVRVARDARLDGDARDRAAHATLVRGFAALAAEMVGGAESVLLMTRDYAIARKQFDRQIGFFQAVKYPIVDMMCGIELARSLALGAAAALDHRRAERGDARAHGEGAGERRLRARPCARACSSTAATASPGTATCTSTSGARCGAAPCSATARHHRRHLATALLDEDVVGVEVS